MTSPIAENKERLTASLRVEINLSCPKCDEYLDVFQEEDCGALNDEGQLWSIIQDSSSAGAWKNLAVECTCKKCGHEFLFDELEY